jgi:hypothetical protein
VTDENVVLSAPVDEPTEEGLRIAQAAKERSLPIRLLGGVAVWVRCPSATRPEIARTYGDVDVIASSGKTKQLHAFFESMGYVPDKLFNAIHGATRLNYMDPVRNRPLDVLLDRFIMCHTIDFKKRLGGDELTIPLADLLLTKLQVVEINEKDLKDLTALFIDHEIGDGSNDSIDTGRLGSVLNADWGFEHTVRANLKRLDEGVTAFGLPAATNDLVAGRIAKLIHALDTGKKSIGWKSRAVVGERVRWYELPEDVRH